jgi:hypothetical protein
MFYETEEEIRRRITRRFRRRLWFFVQLFLTIPVGLLFDSFRYTSRFATNFLLAAWFASLFIHGVILYIDGAKERAIQREIERQQHLALQLSGKPKRSSRLSVGDDGELVDMPTTDNGSRDSSTH